MFHLLFTTDNSTYEIDQDGLRIRRLEGVANPTPRQGADGEWKKYLEVSPVEIGAPVVMIWRYVNGLAQATKTSRVRQIIDKTS